MRTDAAAIAVDAAHHGAPAVFRGIGTDSRQRLEGRLFVALRGPRFDGHEFVDEAIAAGAAGVMLERKRDLPVPHIVCPDTLAALGLLGSAWAQRRPAVFIGVTGSNGKTTVKDMIRAILSRAGRTTATEANYNNEIGVPLTLARVDDEDDFAVIEMGAGKPGDIAYLTGLIRPHIGIVTNAGPAHLEFLGDLDGVAREKGALYRALRSEGTAVINADDRYCSQWRDATTAQRVVTFGLGEDADVRAELAGDALRISAPQGELAFEWKLRGAHHAANAAGATAAALAAGAVLADVESALSDFETASGRFVLRDLGRGVCVIDDAYNANPASLAAAIDSVDTRRSPAWLVLGQLAELGPETPRYHREAGEHARRAGFQRLFALGPNAKDSAEGFGKGAECFEDHAALSARLIHAVEGPLTLLVKGSRSAGLERVIAAVERGLEERR